MAFDMLRFRESHFQVFRQLTGEVVTTDRHAPLPNPEPVADDQVRAVRSDGQHHGAFGRRIGVEGGRCQQIMHAVIGQHVVQRDRRKLNDVDFEVRVIKGSQLPVGLFPLHRKQTDFCLQRIAVFDLASGHHLVIPNNVCQIKGNLLARFIAHQVGDFLDFNRRWLEKL